MQPKPGAGAADARQSRSLPVTECTSADAPTDDAVYADSRHVATIATDLCKLYRSAKHPAVGATDGPTALKGILQCT